MTLPAQRDRRESMAAWVTLNAPGALVTCTILSLALWVTPRLVPFVLVDPRVRMGAAALLLLHIAVTVLVVRWPGRWLLARLFAALLVTDAAACGVLLGAQWNVVALLLAGAVLITSLEAQGTLASLGCAGAVVAGSAAAGLLGIERGLFVPVAVSFPTALAIDTSFGGGAVLQDPVVSFPTVLSVETGISGAQVMTFPTGLSVETWVAGVPAFATPQELFLPSLAVVLAALLFGMATNIWRVRRARQAVAASIVAAARATP